MGTEIDEVAIAALEEFDVNGYAKPIVSGLER